MVWMFFFFGVAACVWTVVAAESASQQTDVGLEPPMLDARAFLIRDPAIMEALRLTEQQSEEVRQLSSTLDGLLFSLRDADPRPTDASLVSAINQIHEKLTPLSQILSPAQQQRLLQLRRQYEGIVTLFRPEVTQQLKLTDAQLEKIRRLYQQSARQQKAAASKDNAANQIQQIQTDQLRQTMQVLDEPQRKQWLQMLGEPFDFSKRQPVFFPAPELRQVSAWINSEPLSMESLRGKVVIVHFWTFGCINCIHNYPAYKDWTGGMMPTKVVMLGIHTPEFESEKDLAAFKQKVRSEGLEFPIAVDNDKANWNVWSNRIWPAVYLVDKSGRVRFWWYGELNWQAPPETSGSPNASIYC